MKNVIKPLTKSVLILLGLTAAAAAADAGINKKTLGSGSNNNNNTIIIKSNDEMKKIAKIVEFLVCYQGELVKQIKMKLKNK